MKKTWIGIFTALLLAGQSLPASANFGTGIGISLPMGSSTKKTVSSESYASFSNETMVQEFTVTEKRGCLVLELKISNISDTLYSIDHPTEQAYDFVVLDKNGAVLYRWSDGMTFTQALCTVSYPAHESTVYTAEIDRQKYKAIRENAAFAAARLTDTPYTLTTKIPAAVVTTSNPAVLHGGIIIGRGSW